MPERSGHCIQGMRLRRFHCLPHRARRRSRVSICKSGNLLGMWEALPVERNTPNWHRQPVISDMGSRNGIDLKECCLEGNEYTQYTSLSSGFRCCSAGDFWTSYRETFRRRSVRLYCTASDCTPQCSPGLCFCLNILKIEDICLTRYLFYFSENCMICFAVCLSEKAENGIHLYILINEKKIHGFYRPLCFDIIKNIHMKVLKWRKNTEKWSLNNKRIRKRLFKMSK